MKDVFQTGVGYVVIVEVPACRPTPARRFLASRGHGAEGCQVFDRKAAAQDYAAELNAYGDHGGKAKVVRVRWTIEDPTTEE